MNSFCVGTVADNPHLRAADGIIRADALPLTADARRAARLLARDAQAKADDTLRDAQVQADGILRDARSEAGVLVGNARDSAGEIVADAREQARRLTADEEQRVVVQAAGLLQALEQANAAILEGMEEMVAGLAQTLYDRLVMDTTPRERIGAALRRVLHEAPPKLVDALLRVHPDDVALLPELDWPVKTDTALAPGACRLEASNGQWCANFDLAVQALKTAFAQGIDSARRAAPAADGPECGALAGADREHAKAH